jgi:predicted P-loop ATPase/GTPase
MKLLVAGGSEVDAGKTTFTTGLVERTGLRGFKPRAGNGYWYDHDDVRRSVRSGRLYGTDAERLAAASPGGPGPESINPVHRLWLPRPGAGKGLLGRDERAFVVDRVTPPGDGAAHPVINGTVEIPSAVADGLPLSDAVAVESLPELNDLMARLHGPALDALGDRIAERDAAVVESYADIARPLAGFVPDAVAVVEPRRCRVYDGERYAKACEVAGGSARAGRFEKRVDHVTDLLDPAATATLPALSGDDRGDPGAVVDAYADAYTALLESV